MADGLRGMEHKVWVIVSDERGLVGVGEYNEAWVGTMKDGGRVEGNGT